MKIIMHIDLDAFYSSCEEKRRPELKDRAVVIGDLNRKRSVVTTANYKAREFGIRSGMPTKMAYELCKNAVFIAPDFEFYVKTSNEIMRILKKHALKFEQASIDEAYLDISNSKNFENAEKLANKIKKEIFEKFEITCSIGISINKLIAKIASNHKKPNGLTIIRPKEVSNFLENKNIGEIPGIGPKTRKVLENFNITTFKDLRQADNYLLLEIFGKNASKIKKIAQGIGNDEITEEKIRKSISEEYTFEGDIYSFEKAEKFVDIMAEELSEKLIAENFLFKTLTLKIRYSDFKTISKSITIPPNNSKEIIAKFAKKLLMGIDFSMGIRLLGVKLSNLRHGQKRLLEYIDQ